jgi:hypothetical protein
VVFLAIWRLARLVGDLGPREPEVEAIVEVPVARPTLDEVFAKYGWLPAVDPTTIAAAADPTAREIAARLKTAGRPSNDEI